MNDLVRVVTADRATLGLTDVMTPPILGGRQSLSHVGDALNPIGYQLAKVLYLGLIVLDFFCQRM